MNIFSTKCLPPLTLYIVPAAKKKRQVIAIHFQSCGDSSHSLGAMHGILETMLKWFTSYTSPVPEIVDCFFCFLTITTRTFASHRLIVTAEAVTAERNLI